MYLKQYMKCMSTLEFKYLLHISLLIHFFLKTSDVAIIYFSPGHFGPVRGCAVQQHRSAVQSRGRQR